MEVSLDEFVASLVSSKLISSEEVAEFQQSLTPEQRPASAKALAQLLVEAKKLTEYQAAAIYQGKPQGLVLGNYVVLDKIGAGGMGRVVKADHMVLGRVVAIKLLASRIAESPRAIKRFQRETRAAARLEHHNVVRIYDADEDDGIHYLVMEYVDGPDLQSLVKQKGPLPVADAIDYITQAAHGLQYAHRQGIVHRDIKPGNLLLSGEGVVKILDMGLARVEGMLHEDEGSDVGELTRSGQVLGTPNYMAPEQAVEAHEADARSDIYGLGCTLYRLLTGEVPYPGKSLMKVLVGHRESPIPSLLDNRPEIPRSLDQVFRKMIAKRPEDRYQSMANVIDALERVRSVNPAADQEVPLEPAAEIPLTSSPPPVQNATVVEAELAENIATSLDSPPLPDTYADNDDTPLSGVTRPPLPPPRTAVTPPPPRLVSVRPAKRKPVPDDPESAQRANDRVESFSKYSALKVMILMAVISCLLPLAIMAVLNSRKPATNTAPEVPEGHGIGSDADSDGSRREQPEQNSTDKPDQQAVEENQSTMSSTSESDAPENGTRVDDTPSGTISAAHSGPDVTMTGNATSPPEANATTTAQPPEFPNTLTGQQASFKTALQSTRLELARLRDAALKNGKKRQTDALQSALAAFDADGHIIPSNDATVEAERKKLESARQHLILAYDETILLNERQGNGPQADSLRDQAKGLLPGKSTSFFADQLTVIFQTAQRAPRRPEDGKQIEDEGWDRLKKQIKDEDITVFVAFPIERIDEQDGKYNLRLQRPDELAQFDPQVFRTSSLDQLQVDRADLHSLQADTIAKAFYLVARGKPYLTDQFQKKSAKPHRLGAISMTSMATGRTYYVYLVRPTYYVLLTK